MTDLSGLWKVCRLNAKKLEDPRQRELLEWVASHDVDVLDITPWLSISQENPSGQLRLHLSRFVYERAGGKRIDHAMERVHSEPLVIPIDSYPGWLPEVANQLEQNGA